MSRFARSSKNSDFSCVAKNRKSDYFSRSLRFFAVLCHVINHWSSERVVDLTKFAKTAKNCTQQQKFRFFVCCEKSQVWLFFALVAIFRSSLSCYQSLKFRASCRFNKICENCEKLHAAAKIPIFRVLRKIASLTIFCVTSDFSQFFVMLIIT